MNIYNQQCPLSTIFDPHTKYILLYLFLIFYFNPDCNCCFVFPCSLYSACYEITYYFPISIPPVCHVSTVLIINTFVVCIWVSSPFTHISAHSPTCIIPSHSFIQYFCLYGFPQFITFFFILLFVLSHRFRAQLISTKLSAKENYLIWSSVFYFSFFIQFI